MSDRVLRIGNVSGFFGDRLSAARELIDSAEVDVISGDWLAELTMFLLQRQKARDPAAGFARTFIEQLEDVLGDCVERGIKIVSNAGGINPEGCASAVREVADRLGLPVRVGTVSGDDLLPGVQDLVAAGSLRDLRTGLPLARLDAPLAANAYLGGWGIAGCLEAGADVVVTGRVADASLVVGPAAWAFGWRPDDWDALAGAVAAGHVIECGGQATGGNFSFFDEVDGLGRVGFPIAEIERDGSSVITKGAGTGGLVTTDTVTAQLLYEIAGPAYANPDVTAHLDSVSLTQVGVDRVRMSGAVGSPPPEVLKVSTVTDGGFRNSMTVVMTGLDAERKAALAEHLVWDLVPGGRASFDDVCVEHVGRGLDDPPDLASGMSLLRIAVAGPDRARVGRGFSSAVIQSGLSSYPGFFMTTPPTDAEPVSRFVPSVVSRELVRPTSSVDGQRVPEQAPGVFSPWPVPAVMPDAPEADLGGAPRPPGPFRTVPLGTVCGARSGDKGGDANLGFWCRSETAYEWLVTFLDERRLARLLPAGSEHAIERFSLPRLLAVNFVVSDWLGTGVSACLRLDSQAKGLAEYVRARQVPVPVSVLDSLTAH